MKKVLAILLLACLPCFATTVYWKKNVTDDHWATANNWYSDAACTTPLGRAPVSGEDTTVGTGVSSNYPQIYAALDMGTGVCDIPGVINAYTVPPGLSGGVWTGSGFINGVVPYGVITGGTFTGSGLTTAMFGAYFYGGLYPGVNVTLLGTSSVYGGIWTGSGRTISGTIYDGFFSGANFTCSGVNLYGGMYTGAGFTRTSGTTTGGTWLLSGPIRINGVWYRGSCDPVPGGGTPVFKYVVITPDVIGTGLQ